MTTQESASTLYLTVDGIQLAYCFIDKGNTTNSPLLILNHFRSSIHLWDLILINGLASSGYQIITYDYACTGQSGDKVLTTITGFTVTTKAFLRTLLPALHNVQSVDILSISMGGYVAQQLTIDASEPVVNQVLAGVGQSLGPAVKEPTAEVQSTTMAPRPDAGLSTFPRPRRLAVHG